DGSPTPSAPAPSPHTAPAFHPVPAGSPLPDARARPAASARADSDRIAAPLARSRSAPLQFYPNLRERMLRVVLVHPGAVILPELGESLGRYAQKVLAQRGVEIRLNTRVTSMTENEVCLIDSPPIPSSTLIWTAGTMPNPLLS